MPEHFTPRPFPDPGTLTIRPLQDRTGLMLAGEADITSRAMLHAALAALPAESTGEIHLDLTGLRFIDVSCTRELIAIADRHPAVRLIGHNPPPSLLRITALLYPEARIMIAGRACRLTEAAGCPGLIAGPGCDGHDSDRACSLMTGPERLGRMTVTDVIDLITDDHARIRWLFTALEEFAHDGEQMIGSPASGRNDEMAGEIWAALSWLLEVHIDAEDEICRLAMGAAVQPSDLLEASFGQHGDIREALAEARLCETGSRRWCRALADARSATFHHLRAEENHVLAAFRRETGREIRETLGRQWTSFIVARLRDDAAGPDRRDAPADKPMVDACPRSPLTTARSCRRWLCTRTPTVTRLRMMGSTVASDGRR